MEELTLLKIKKYLHGVKPLFINGQLRLVSENGVIKITYKDAFVDYTVKEKINETGKRAYKQVVNFCFNAYVDNEWDGTPKTSEEIGRLLDLSDGQVRRILNRIYKKLNEY
jgi:DNA-directed RNA polymerase specialized sigma subunit